MEEITNKEEKEILKQKRIANAIAEELNVRSIQVEKTIEEEIQYHLLHVIEKK